MFSVVLSVILSVRSSVAATIERYPLLLELIREVASRYIQTGQMKSENRIELLWSLNS